ncbi:hypothetical protein H2198_003985 [Neophaeococcomyces mojaviensis]|uniref:Uncharacterized protein n=1 Tax=Neophaeococcomyces mojaviensis TaxID=3383035 RepID=A0ACC3A9X4_9EURO|nr:hypothetical protein H2198_003985 [Knufia sp. JES_112]
MECDICQRKNEQPLNFFCAACARNAAYIPRLEHAQILLEKSALDKNVAEAVTTKQTEDLQASHGHNIWQAELKHVGANETKQRLEQAKESASLLRQESDELRQQIQELKLKIEAKKKALETVQSTVQTNREERLSEILGTNTRISSSVGRLSERFSSNRAILCREAASLMRLRQRRRQRDTPGREQYSIAGLTLPDLRQISNVRCTDLTAVLGSVARLVVLVAFYLGIRLPAEITLPHTEHPFATINLPKGSYLGKKLDISRMSVPSSEQSSPSASKHESMTLVIPRSLFLGGSNKPDERVFQFQQKQEHAFNFFIEGIALLAWDVAWLCRSQGFTSGTNTWEEVCNIGKNLHHLIITQSPAMPLTRIASDRTMHNRTQQDRKPSPLHTARKDIGAGLGKYSDLSAVNHGSNAERSEVLRSWKYIGWQTIAAPLRKLLYEENVSAEWELLKDQEWDDGGEHFDEAVFVKSKALDGQQHDDARSVMTTGTRLEDEATIAGRVPGTSGWTKLKSREKP